VMFRNKGLVRKMNRLSKKKERNLLKMKTRIGIRKDPSPMGKSFKDVGSKLSLIAVSSSPKPREGSQSTHSHVMREEESAPESVVLGLEI